MPVAASARVAGNFSGVVPESPEPDGEVPGSSDSVAAKTIGVRAAPAATAPAAPITPRRETGRFLRWEGECGVADTEVTFQPFT
ncbi:hypothetical protein GCM10027074_46650 [Streptomyces deserti]